jgi:hypothetical protein
MTTKEILVKARALISDSEHWSKEDAIQGPAYCALGALWMAMEPGETLDPLLQVFHMQPSDLIAFNDSRTHTEVLALFDKAIARAK